MVFIRGNFFGAVYGQKTVQFSCGNCSALGLYVSTNCAENLREDQKNAVDGMLTVGRNWLVLRGRAGSVSMAAVTKWVVGRCFYASHRWLTRRFFGRRR